METSLSANSYMRSPRSVTLAPTFMPERTLKLAMDFLALVTSGFWPEMVASSVTASSRALELSLQSPRPMLMTIFSSRGISMTFL